MVSSQPVVSFNTVIRNHVKNGCFKQAFNVFHHMRTAGHAPDNYTIPVMAKACISLSALQEGMALHSLSVKLGIHCNLFVQTSLLDLYCKLANLSSARQLFEEMHQTDTVSCNAFFTCLAKSADEVCSFLNLMRHRDVKPDLATMIAIVGSFGSPYRLYQGMSVHCLAIKSGLIFCSTSATSFVNMYSKGGDLGSAWNLFEEMTFRDLISWNAMIGGCCQNGSHREAVELFLQMGLENVNVDSTCLLTIMSALSHLRCLRQGQCVHAFSLKHGMEHDVLLCNSIVDMYVKCSDLRSAEALFQTMEFVDVTSWNPVIHGCLSGGHYAKAAAYFREMVLLDGRVDEITLSCVASVCANLRELRVGKSVHGWELKRSGYLNPSVGNALITMYSKCEKIIAAISIFKGLCCRDIVSWNSMIDGLVRNAQTSEAFSYIHHMQFAGVRPDSITILAILPLCAELSLLEQGRAIHGLVIRRKFNADSSVTNSLVDMYLKCGDVRSGELLFEMMPERDLVSWNTMIAGYSQNGYAREAWSLFREYFASGLTCSLTTLLAILPSCDCEETLRPGMSLHSWMLKLGFSAYGCALNALMFMYINCGDLSSSCLLFQDALTPDLVAWNTIIAGCTQFSFYIVALDSFHQMRTKEMYPDSITLVSVLSACGNLELLGHGMAIHNIAVKMGLISDVRVSNTLILMYSRCKFIEASDAIFAGIEHRNICSWNSMISSLVQNGFSGKAIELFHQMEFEPNEITLVNMISVCTGLGALTVGKSINGHIFRLDLLQNVYINAALVDMYSKCGRLDIAVRTFHNSVKKSVVSWNSMIAAYGFHGFGGKALELFSEMCIVGIKPTKSTFISLLSACGHSGLVDEGLKHFCRMYKEFNISPTTEHYVCMVDLLGKAGRIGQACDFIKEMETEGASGVWGALLSACKAHANLEVGEQVAHYLFELDPGNIGYYVSLSNMYAAAGNWLHASNLRDMIRDRGLKKHAGWSLIDVSSGEEQIGPFSRCTNILARQNR